MSSFVRLKEVANLTVGYVGAMAEQYVDEGIPFLRSLNIKPYEIDDGNIKYISEEFNEKIQKSILHEGDIVIVRTGAPGTCCVVPAVYEGCNCSDVVIVRPDKNKVNAQFLAGYINVWGKKQISNNKVGAVQKHYNVHSAEDMQIPDFNIEDQKKIAKILEKINQKIICNQKINDNLQHQLRLMYDYWFTQFDFPDINGNPYKSSGGLMTWNGQLNQEIPYGWRVGTVGDCVARIATGLNPRDNFTLGQGSIKYLTVKNLTTSGAIDFSNCDTVNESARRIIHRRSDVHTGDILFASIAPLGRCHLIQEEPKGWDINESIFSIRPNLAITSAELLYAYFTSESFVKGATYSSTGSVFKGIRINTLLDSQMLIPPLNISLAFSDGVRRLLLQTNSNMNESEHLTKLRDWLLPMLMNGQAIVSD